MLTNDIGGCMNEFAIYFRCSCEIERNVMTSLIPLQTMELIQNYFDIKIVFQEK